MIATWYQCVEQICVHIMFVSISLKQVKDQTLLINRHVLSTRHIDRCISVQQFKNQEEIINITYYMTDNGMYMCLTSVELQHNGDEYLILRVKPQIYILTLTERLTRLSFVFVSQWFNRVVLGANIKWRPTLYIGLCWEFVCH